MSTIFVIRQADKVREVNVNNEQLTSSKYITENLAPYQNSTLKIEVPDRYNKVIDIYLNFLQLPKPYNYLRDNTFSDDREGLQKYDPDTAKYPIIGDTQTLLTCFELESYFIDETFFRYLMVQVYRLWSNFQQCISRLPNDRLFYLHIPYPLVPERFTMSSSFRDEWLTINGDSQIKICSKSTFTNYYTLYCTLVERHVDSQLVDKLRVTQYSFRSRYEAPSNHMTTEWSWETNGNFLSVIQPSAHLGMRRYKPIG